MPHFSTEDVRAREIEDTCQKVTLIVDQLRPMSGELLSARAELRKLAARPEVPQWVLKRLELVEAALSVRGAHLNHHTFFTLGKTE